jgi:adenylate cyclase
MWADALALFREALALRPDDRPSRTLAQRCLEHEAAPPESWDGVFEQRFK